MLQQVSIAEALSWAKKHLQGGESPALDAKVLLCYCLQCRESYLHTWPEKLLTQEQNLQFQQLVNKRQLGQPVAHLTGERDFWTLTLQVSPKTLIPRPETELLVEQALALPLPDNANILDLGTGTGAIALALASERPNWSVTAVDFDEDIVQLAKVNAHANKITNVQIMQSDWFSALSAQQFDLIVSNPPYVEPDSPFLLQGDVRFEPLSALTADEEGLKDIRLIVEQAAHFLNNKGYILLEHGHLQQQSVNNLLEINGFSNVSCIQDFANFARISVANFSNTY
ncbi:peptide chain release factor N(5)-glutamine methyltransferase [Alteromonadaceae bacterium BrNp21-10]|nr:peptide chain release factor N(5)-glutamine methyltransferase [Alteromonadaceae bacterium BrNp21-10]